MSNEHKKKENKIRERKTTLLPLQLKQRRPYRRRWCKRVRQIQWWALAYRFACVLWLCGMDENKLAKSIVQSDHWKVQQQATSNKQHFALISINGYMLTMDGGWESKKFSFSSFFFLRPANEKKTIFYLFSCLSMLRLVSFAEITEHFLRDGLNPAETFRQLTGISLFIRDAAKLLFSFLLFFFVSFFSFTSLRLLFC